MEIVKVRGSHAKFFTILVILFLGISPSAQAHSSLISSEPSEGQTLVVIPQSVTLTFNEKLIEIENQVVNSLTLVNESSGESTPLVVTTSGPTMKGEVPVGTYSVGGYQLKYRVVSADGHPITGTISFSTTTETKVSPSLTNSAEPSAPEENSTSRQSQILYFGILILVALALWRVQRTRKSDE